MHTWTCFIIYEIYKLRSKKREKERGERAEDERRRGNENQRYENRQTPTFPKHAHNERKSVNTSFLVYYFTIGRAFY